MKRLISISILLLLLMVPTIFAAELKGKLVLTGSSTVAPLAAEIGKRFELEHPGVRIDVQTGGSSRGVADARRGIADIGMVSRDLKPKEKDLIPFTLAKDGVAIILHKTNSVKNLSNQQIIDIYRGKITNWKALGGKNRRITVVNKAEGHSTLELFLKYFGLKNSQVKAHVIIGDNQQGIKTVSGNPNAIGYVSVGAAEYSATHHIPIKLLPMKGVSASVKNVASGKFPLARPLNLVTKELPQGLVKEFLEYSLSKKVHDLIRQQYFVPINK